MTVRQRTLYDLRGSPTSLRLRDPTPPELGLGRSRYRPECLDPPASHRPSPSSDDADGARWPPAGAPGRGSREGSLRGAFAWSISPWISPAEGPSALDPAPTTLFSSPPSEVLLCTALFAGLSFMVPQPRAVLRSQKWVPLSRVPLVLIICLLWFASFGFPNGSCYPIGLHVGVALVLGSFPDHLRIIWYNV